MATWGEVLDQYNQQPNDQAKATWLNAQMDLRLREISSLREDRNVLLYGSAFLQKPQLPGMMISITAEDINGLMPVLHGMDWSKGLTIVLHTPGGVTTATETIVAYLRTKFPYVETIVPTYAMSAGTMIALSSELIVLGRQSQLGPIDAQMGFGQGRFVSARAVVDQFERAKLEIVGDPSQGVTGNLDMAHVWAPVLATIGPALLQEAQNALDYSERMVAAWLSNYMFKGEADRVNMGKSVAEHFNDASMHLSHGRRIDRNDARGVGVIVEDLEDSQVLQEAVLTLYHLLTIAFEQSTATKLIAGTSGGRWFKQWSPPVPVIGGPFMAPGPVPGP